MSSTVIIALLRAVIKESDRTPIRPFQASSGILRRLMKAAAQKQKPLILLRKSAASYWLRGQDLNL
jgi:hypothetical protein